MKGQIPVCYKEKSKQPTNTTFTPSIIIIKGKDGYLANVLLTTAAAALLYLLELDLVAACSRSR